MVSDDPQLPGSRASSPSAEELCSYIAEICGELRALTRHPTFRTLNYLLDMARLEAERMARDLKGRDGTQSTSPGR